MSDMVVVSRAEVLGYIDQRRQEAWKQWDAKRDQMEMERIYELDAVESFIRRLPGITTGLAALAAVEAARDEWRDGADDGCAAYEQGVESGFSRALRVLRALPIPAREE